jgi:hypothetical protein
VFSYSQKWALLIPACANVPTTERSDQAWGNAVKDVDHLTSPSVVAYTRVWIGGGSCYG